MMVIKYIPGTVQDNIPLRETVCSYCPFKKDRPFWLDQSRYDLNIERLDKNIPQECHRDLMESPEVHTLCLGQKLCAQGGNYFVYSPEEFRAQQPLHPLEMKRAYHGTS